MRFVTIVWLVLVVVSGGPAADLVGQVVSKAEPGAKTRVPAWDARGVGPLPWQGIACLQANDDLSLVSVGTIAPPGDPNVLLLDGAGQLVRTFSAGERWIDQIALDAEHGGAFALCTMPQGAAFDFCTLYGCFRQTTALPASLTQDDFPLNLFHYGEHSNHSGAQVRALRWPDGAKTVSGAAVVMENRVLLFSGESSQPAATLNFARPPQGATVSLAGSRTGHVLVGCTGRTSRPGDAGPDTNLFLMSHQGKTLWSRHAESNVDANIPLEKGPYGNPTLPDGTRPPLPQYDVPITAPRSLAVFGEPELTRIAVADYPGWQRWIRSSATGRDQNYGVRFQPARPAVTVYDAQGKALRRFAPEQFKTPTWLDLQFLAGGKQLVAYPHRWTSRGLAGQPTLPADEQANTIYRLDLDSGDVRTLEFPDAVSDVATCNAGVLLASCWNGRVYTIRDEQWRQGQLPAGIDVGGPAIVALSRDGSQSLAATSTGVLHRFDAQGKPGWKTDLNTKVPRVPKPWMARASGPQIGEQIGEGIWQFGSGRVGSDLGGQRVIVAPQGLLLIEGHAGLSFELEWAAMEACGLDPRQVKYVMATHEHGDHAPGAYLWRVATGAQFVCSEEMAYTLQHHIPLCSGYGFHPPVPTDLRVKEDTDLDLAGLTVRGVRIPGHTFGSMAWMFTKGSKKYVSIGDLIMPDGVLGYAGSINFSGADVLASLRKLQSLKVDVVLPGHGPWGDPDRYIAAGISVGRHVGWGKTPAEEPDPYFRLNQKNVLVTAWNIDATSAAFGDVNGDGKPDAAIVAAEGSGSVVKLFLNNGGRFDLQPDKTLNVPGVGSPTRIRTWHANRDRKADLMISGADTALLTSHAASDESGLIPEYDVEVLGIGHRHQVRTVDDAQGKTQVLLGAQFGSIDRLLRSPQGKPQFSALKSDIRGPYPDVQVLDLNGDGKTDIVTSVGQVYLRQADGNWPDLPTQTLPMVQPDDWHFLAAGDINGDGRPDVVLASYGMKRIQASVFLNRGPAERPFLDEANATLDIAAAHKDKPELPLLRDSLVTTDWNNDGVTDLVLARGQDNKVLVLFGAKDGLTLDRSATIDLNYRLHYETGISVADFNGDGRMDVAALGYTNTGVGAGGPLAVYVWLQPAD